MKLKNVLFSSLFLSATLAACTNDEFATVETPEVNVEDGISLGEGFIIAGVKGSGYVDTKGYYELNENGVPLAFWNNTDEIGAAWYNMVPAAGGLDENNVVLQNHAFTNGYFMSNERFEYDSPAGENGAYFKAESNIMTGAYVLYYPYNKNVVTSAYTEIPVTLEPADVECAEGQELEGISKNIFAYSAAAFVPGGAQTENFRMKYAHVLYRVMFNAKHLNHVGLTPSWTIKKIILEAKDAAGNNLLTTTGKVTANNNGELTTDDYNNYVADWQANPLPEPDYESTAEGAVDHFTLDVNNSDQEGYRIDKLDEDTKPFWFSMLPLIDEADNVTVKVLVEDREGNELVFAKTYEDGVAEDQGVLDVFNNRGTQPNGVVNIVVRLDTQKENDVIYTNEQFIEKWNEALQSNAAQTLVLGDPLTLDMDLTVGTTVSGNRPNITIESANDANHKLTVNNIDVKYGVLNIATDVEVKGDVASSGAGTLNVDNNARNNNLSVEGSIEIQGSAYLNVNKMETMYVVNSTEVSVKLPEADQNGEIGTIEVRDNGDLTLISGAFNNIVTDANSRVSISQAVTNSGTYTGVLNSEAAMFTNNGTFIGSLTEGSLFTNNSTATINEASQDVQMVNNGTLNIEIPGGTDNDALFVASNSKNNGTINVNQGVLREEATGALTQDNAAARIYVEENGKVWLYNWNSITDGWVVLNHKDGQLEPANQGRTKFSVKEAGDMNATTDAAYQSIDAPMTLEGSINGNTYICGDITLSGNLSTIYNLWIGADVKISTTEESATLNVNGGAVLTVVPYTLTIGNGVTLGGSGKFASEDDWKNTLIEGTGNIALSHFNP